MTRDLDNDPADESELRHELNLAFTELGAVTFALVHHRAVSDKRLVAKAQRIYELYARLYAGGTMCLGN